MFGKAGRYLMGATIPMGLGLALSPATGSVDAMLGSAPVTLSSLGSIGSFTPVTNDQRLARRYAQAAITARSQGFRFTPTVGSMSGRRSITVVVRAPDLDLIAAARSASQSTIGLGPVAYSLGASRGLGRFATEVSASHEAAPLISSAIAAPRGFSLERRKRLSTNVVPDTAALPATAAQLIGGERALGVDLGSSYSLTRNLNVTAGVRYRNRQNRLGPLTDDAQDSQAVYLGTSFRF